MVRQTVLLATLSAWAIFGSAPAKQSTPAPTGYGSTATSVGNLVAFARLYGYVRFFHPSDEAAQIDWTRFAAYGAKEVLKASSAAELQKVLHNLFTPIAPSVAIYSRAQPPGAVANNVVPPDTVGLFQVAWQHLGVGLGPSSVYRSLRLNRRNTVPVDPQQTWGTVTTSIKAAPYQGRNVTYRAAVRMKSVGGSGSAHLWLRVDRPGGKVGFFDNMWERPITAGDWEYHEIKGDVAQDAVAIFFGCILRGNGEAWLDDVQILVHEGDARRNMGPENGNFEEDSVGAPPRGWGGGSPNTPGFEYGVVTGNTCKGKRALHLRINPPESPVRLFARQPDPGEILRKPLGSALTCLLPVSLYADSLSTFPRGDPRGLQDLKNKMEYELPDSLTADQVAVRAANTIVAWNIFQHFYPYFDVVDVDWGSELNSGLQNALHDRDADDHLRSLRKLVAALRDGHGRVIPRDQASFAYWPAISVEWVENNLIVTGVYDTALTCPSVGDVIVEIDGRPSGEVFGDEASLVSAATGQYSVARTLSQFLLGERDTGLKLLIRDAGGGQRLCSLRRSVDQMSLFRARQAAQMSTGRLENGLFFINLTTTPMAAIDTLLPGLSTARGIICDLRGYPAGNHLLLAHLLTQRDTSSHWMSVPQFIYPDREHIAGYAYHGWNIEPKEPRITAPVAFLTDGNAISYAESYMSFVEHYRLGDIVGGPSAGTNGNINSFEVPGGFRIVWTGMRVLKHDGSRHHGIGILPTIPVKRTVQGIREGRDEVLEAAVARLKQRRREQ